MMAAMKQKMMAAMKQKAMIILSITALAFVMAGCAAKPASPRIELSTSFFDMGDINPDEGKIVETFYVKNTGGADLEILSVSTSCGCTEAEVGSENIPPGGQTTLTVTYDPSVHKGLTGKIKRIVYIKSNDPGNGEVELELAGNSLPVSGPEEQTNADGNAGRQKTAAQEKTKGHDEGYEGLLKDFEISPPALYKKIKAGEHLKLLDVREDFEYEENHIKGTRLLSVNKISPEEMERLGLKKDDEIIVYCHSGRRSAKAYEILKAAGYTNVRSLYGGIVHWMEDEYPVEKGSAELIKAAKEPAQGTPSISFDRDEHDFGQIPQSGGVVNTTFQIKNTGGADLEILSVSTSCGCTEAEVGSENIPPGGRSEERRVGKECRSRWSSYH